MSEEKTVREKIVELRESGRTLLEISKEMGLCKSTIHYHLSESGRKKVLEAGRRTRARNRLESDGKNVPKELARNTRRGPLPSKNSSGQTAETTNCSFCKKEIRHSKSSKGTYCSGECSYRHSKELLIKSWKDGTQPGYVVGPSGGYVSLRKPIRKYILEKNNYSCQVCGFNKNHPVSNTTILHIDHIDGNCMNCVEENLRVLCPTCHAMTPNFGARNRGSNRETCIKLRSVHNAGVD